MSKAKATVAEDRKYLVKTVKEAKNISSAWLKKLSLDKVIKFGLPEVDDRHHVWRIPLCDETQNKLGEIVIDAYTTGILSNKTTNPEILEARLLRKPNPKSKPKKTKPKYEISKLRNTVGFGDCVDLLEQMPSQSVDLIFTSPPYFNARPEYSEYEVYEEYLLKMRQVINRAHRVLSEGRFFVINTSPVLLRRVSRNQSSKRIAVTYDLHRIFIEEGFDFIDDIVWVKPEGAGWATGRGRRFAADRNPLQYKAVPVTENVIVYRKRTDLLIDWHIRNHPDQDIVEASKVPDGYEKTNVWKINPNTRSKHPAPFPLELAQKVIRYYSFKNDVVMDPFAGSGTVGAAASGLDRRFVLFDNNPEYIDLMREESAKWLRSKAKDILWLNVESRNNELQPFLDI
ncbi:MAG: hypothetical protein RI951_800 [Pseudomonadota bacterium]|jgi:DNA modification methylase